MPHSSHQKQVGSARSVLLPGLLLLGAVVWLLVEALPVQAGDRSGDWESPLPVAELLERPGGTRSPESATGIESDPLPVEVELEAVALLSVQEPGAGPCELRIRSRLGLGPLPCEVRFAAGPAAGRSLLCEGETVISGLQEGWHLVDLQAGARRTRRLLRLRKELPGELDVTWVTAARLHGRVHDYRGQPLAGARVELGGTSAISDESGDFELEGLVPGGEQVLVLSAEGHATQFERVWVPRPGQKAAALRFVLDAGRTVRGVLHLPGNELRHARIAALPLDRGRLRTPWFLGGAFTDVDVDARGRFTIHGAPRAAFEIGVAHPVWVQRQPARVVANESRVVHLQLDRCPELRGRIQDDEGKGVPAARVRASEGRPGFPAWGSARIEGSVGLPLPGFVRGMGTASAEADAAGNYRVGLPWERSLLTVSAQGFASRQERLRTRRRTARDFVLSPADHSESRSRLVLLFDAPAHRELLLHVRDESETAKQPLRHAADQPFCIPLHRPARIRLSVRVGAGDAQRFELPVLGATRLRVPLGGGELAR